MSRSQILLLAAVLAVAALVGCSGDNGVAPRMDLAAGYSSGIKSVGPSQIVFCFDVSDSVSDAELSSVVAAAGACLSDPDLVPRDGMIGIGALAYGDTVGSVLDTLVALNTESLQDVILPAIEGLLTDRLVGGTGVDLNGAMNAAEALMTPVSVADRHVLVMGTGYADDPAAVRNTSQRLGQAGIMISAIAAGGEASGAELLNFAATATGGYFAEGGEDLGAACADALAYMLHVKLVAMPETAEVDRGDTHTVTVTFFRGLDSGDFPIADGTVAFEIIEGPNVGNGAGATTDTLGLASYSYVGDNGPGTDVIVVSATHPGTGEALTDTVTAVWANTAPTCDAGGPYLATVDADTVMVMLDASGSVDADGDSLTFVWSVDAEGAELDDPAAVMPKLTLTGAALCADSLMVDLVVTDGFDTTSCAAVIRLDDMRPPVIEITDEPYRIWPPNHKYVTLTPDMFIESVEDACGRPVDTTAAVEVVIVRSDEPEDCTGDGRTVEDIIIDCDGSVMLRAERRGGGDGRVYEITYRVTGENEAFSDVTAFAYVPHDASDGMAGDDGDAGYTVEADCDDGDKPRD
jgi:hypothetical protein